MTRFTTDFDDTPPNAPAREVLPVLHSMVDPEWFAGLAEHQQLIVLRHHCKEEGWGRIWPAVAKLLKRGVDAQPNRLTPSQRSQLSTMATHSSWARTPDRAVRTAPARAAFLGRFEQAVDPEGKLPPVQRQQLAAHAKRAYFAGLALRSSVARARKRG